MIESLRGDSMGGQQDPRTIISDNSVDCGPGPSGHRGKDKLSLVRSTLCGLHSVYHISPVHTTLQFVVAASGPIDFKLDKDKNEGQSPRERVYGRVGSQHEFNETVRSCR
jgi:hypothetical protein